MSNLSPGEKIHPSLSELQSGRNSHGSAEATKLDTCFQWSETATSFKSLEKPDSDLSLFLSNIGLGSQTPDRACPGSH